MTSQPALTTYYAPADRAPREVVWEQHDLLTSIPLLTDILDALPVIVTVLNRERQIVYANQALLAMLNLESDAEILGLRPGEALGCVHAHACSGGCGTSEFCRTCGAVRAILDAFGKTKGQEECQILTEGHEGTDALDVLVQGKRFDLAEHELALFVINDISDRKRRQVLERLFFHDILNTAGGLRGFAQLMREISPPGELAETAGTICQISDGLIGEIEAQRILSAAENDQLAVNLVKVDPARILEEQAETYRRHQVAEDRTVEVEAGDCGATLISDPVILGRVVGNLVKNALEATRPGARVSLGCRRTDDGVELWVNNPGMMPREVQLQVFKRSFSTKGGGRGLGTYSVRLLTERYLGGKASFSTSFDQGTTFTVTLPLSPQEAAATA